jgi:hypothetical protein
VKEEYYGRGRTPGDPPHKINVKSNSRDAQCASPTQKRLKIGEKSIFTQPNIADETSIARVSQSAIYNEKI